MLMMRTSMLRLYASLSKAADGVMTAEVIATAGVPFGLMEHWAVRRYVNR
jgi:hypothetical protein